MACASVKHAKGLMKQRNLVSSSLTPEAVLESIHVWRVHDEASQTATLYELPTWIERYNAMNPDVPVQLIIIDSMAFHYRAMDMNGSSNKSQENQDPTYSHQYNKKQQQQPTYALYLQRTKLLTNLATALNDLASSYSLAILAINQMTTKIDATTNTSQLIPALGESWAHAVATRLVVTLDDNHNKEDRSCRLAKSPSQPAGTARFRVIQEGIRDCNVSGGYS